MVRIALITVSGGGNIPPLMRLASELSARGHDVHVLADRGVAGAAAESGASFTELPELGFWQPGRPRSVLRTLAQAVKLVSSRPVEQHVIAELERIGPNVVLVDCLLAGCARAAREAGHPAVVLFHTYLEYWTRNFAGGPVGALGGLRGRSPRRSWDAADLRIVMCDEALDPSGHPPGTLWTGSTERGVAARPEERPLVVASLSTMEVPGQGQAYRQIVRALGDLDVRGLVTLGGLTVEGLDAPANVEVHARLPHDELFPHTSVVIGHGGLSTTFRALAHGIPLVLMPMHPLLDQPLVARSVAAAGAGVVVKRTARAQEIADAVRRVLDDPSFAGAAGRMGERLRSVDGVAAAADAVEGVLSLDAHRPTAPRQPAP